MAPICHPAEPPCQAQYCYITSTSSPLEYFPGQSLLTVDMPVVSHVTRATTREPYLGLLLRLDPRSIALNGQPRSLRLVFLNAWTKTPEGWKFIAWQSTPQPTS
jgi:hypothetical protein